MLDDSRKITLPAGSVTGLPTATTFAVLYSLTDENYIAVPLPAIDELQNSDNVFISWNATSNPDGTYTPPPTAPPGHEGGGDPNYNTP
ncbi:hypothetical protein HME9302_00014 [Alteripontixanthobacter maritimus]|uniref:Uncharacterized protein n=1 Tax=Alteripontixanthobacter maritimus TaxID=2161824 RepID=A0A369QNV2_9SPHN|nr:hypothetical protein HME9302_00014 [Alteripontixanthobacter maritimus]